MASTYSAYKFELIGTGEQAGTWGTTTNTNLGTAIEQAIGGKADITLSSTSTTLTLTDTNALQDARALYLNLTGTPGGAATLEVPAIEKAYIVKNGTTGGFSVTVKVAGQTGVIVENGKSKFVYNNGTDVVEVINAVSGPASSTDNGIALFDGTSGQLIQDSAAQDGYIYGVRIGKGGGGQTTNVVVGPLFAMNSNTTGSYNSAFGAFTLQYNTTGGDNTAIGGRALEDNTTGSDNTAVGMRALEQCTTGFSNVGLGKLALRSLNPDGGISPPSSEEKLQRELDRSWATDLIERIEASAGAGLSGTRISAQSPPQHADRATEGRLIPVAAAGGSAGYKGCGWVIEVGVIGQVEELGPELQLRSLSEGELTSHGQIDLPETKAAQPVPSERPLSSRCR